MLGFFGLITREDPVFSYVKESAQTRPWILRVYLFGSRARGDHRPESDYDFAFELKPSSSQAPEWARFSLELTERSPTLHKLDLVVLGECGPGLEQRIQNERVLIYEKK